MEACIVIDGHPSKYSLSLKGACRFALLKARALSAVRNASALAFSTSASEFAVNIVTPALCKANARANMELMPPEAFDLTPEAVSAMRDELYPLGKVDLEEMRMVWNRIKDLPPDQQIAFQTFFRRMMLTVEPSKGQVEVGKDIFEFLFYFTLKFDD
jgi:hypothetical protein